MNLRNVLRAFSSLRQLTDDESAFLQTLHAMSDTERELLVESLQPEKGSGKRKVVKKSGSKSQRASSMAATLEKNLGQQRQAPIAKNDTCAVENCFAGEDDPIHDQTLGYLNSHRFQPTTDSAQAASGG